jgi:hypothetical protein
MINVAQFGTAVDATEGDVIALLKSQLAVLLTELEIGQNARLLLTGLKAVTAIAASTSGVPA